MLIMVFRLFHGDFFMKKNKFKILQVCNSDFYLDNFLGELVIQLNEKGYEVDCICEGNEISSRLKSHVSKLIYFSFPKVGSIFIGNGW